MRYLLSVLCVVTYVGEARAQPSCYGTVTNSTTGVVSYYALQYKATSPKTWFCALIPGGVPGPQGPAGASLPPMLDCGSSPTQIWDGLTWTCVATDFLIAR